MKQTLLAFVLAISLFNARAQTVVVKDSSINNLMASFGIPGPVTNYTYDSSCRLIVKQSPTAQYLFSYYPTNSVYQIVHKNYLGNTQTNVWVWVNSDRTTYTYNEGGKVTSLVSGYWDTLSGTFPDAFKDTITYNQDGYKIKSTYQSWDKTLQTWTTGSDTSFYYNKDGRTDSLNATEYPSEHTTHLYFKYYSGSGKLYQITTYSSQYNDSSLSTYYYDSSNYISRDSIVLSSGVTYDSVFLPTTYTKVTYYDINNNKIEEDYSSANTGLLDGSSYTKIFYTYGSCSSVFPVTLLYFTGSNQNNNAILQWQTANETNTYTFGIQRSTDGEHFTTIGTVGASGNSGVYKNYSYHDADAFTLMAPKLYYRLAETDKNGNILYSKTVTMNAAIGKASMYISPNPVSGIANLYTASTIDHALVTITDLKGRVLYSGARNITAGNHISIDVSSFAKGLYMVTIQSPVYKQQLKMIKE